jgi:F0F1-type ATP synthase assembly protein I
MQEDQRQNDQDGERMTYARWAGVGIEFAGVVAVFCAIGYWLDQKWNTSPWLLLTGFFIGFAGMFYNIWKQTRDMRQK